MYETARVKDNKNSEDFYKLVKYVIAKTEDGKPKDNSNLIVRDFLKKYNLDLIEIPEEFKDIEVENEFKVERKAKANKKRIYTRSDKNLDEYDVWRCVDRGIISPTG